jgi:hypothetical protein
LGECKDEILRFQQQKHDIARAYPKHAAPIIGFNQISRIGYRMISCGSFGVMWVKQFHVHHPPVITICIGGINHSQSWVVKMALFSPHDV